MGGAVHSIGEKDLVKHIDVLAHWLIWVQWHNLALNESDSACRCSLQEIVVNLGYCSVFLHALDEVLRREVLNDLEFFVPIV